MEVRSRNLNFSVEELNLIISALFNGFDNKKFIANVDKLFKSFDSVSYAQDIEKQTRVYVILKLTDALLNSDISDRNEILPLLDVNGQFRDMAENILNGLSQQFLTDEQIAIADNKVSNKLKAILIETKGDELVRMYNNFKTDNYDDFNAMLKSFEDASDELSASFKKVRETIEERKNIVSTANESLTHTLSALIEDEKNPSTKIKTGIRAINDMLGGGFEKSRVYVPLGMPKGWKSAFSFSCAIWAKKYNKDIKTKNPNRKPLILYITLENTVKETVKRAVTYAAGNSLDYSNVDDVYLHNLLVESGYLSNNENDITEPSIEIMYKPNKSISVRDIDVIIDDYDKQGFETVFLIVDYIKRLKPIEKQKELRTEYGAIVDDLQVLAKEREIPVVAPMQLNRAAIKDFTDTNNATLDEACAAARQIGASNISESIDIIQNADCAFALSLFNESVEDADGSYHKDMWLIFRMLAKRFNTRADVPEMIAHRFVSGNGMRLIEDLNLTSEQSIDVSNIKSKTAQGQIYSQRTRF